MSTLVDFYSENQFRGLVSKRDGETKVGECIPTLSSLDHLSTCSSRFVLMGIPEDIGVRANMGRGGAWSAWDAAVKSIVNIQSTDRFTGHELAIIGAVHVSDLMQRTSKLDAKKQDELVILRSVVSELDERVEKVVQKILEADKIPIVIGGGHNNALPLLRAASKSFSSKRIGCINLDAHSDYRGAEGRHSGNSFRYAHAENLLERMVMFGLQESYNSKQIIQELTQHADIFQLHWFESMLIYGQDHFAESLSEALHFIKSLPCGVELDMDSVENIPSSARTPSGFSSNQARMFAYRCGKSLNVKYFHIAEAAPVLAHRNADFKTGKLISFLISDFIKGVQH
jgi:formiminoglutamase